MTVSKMVSLTIDGVPVSVPQGTLIVNAAKKAGIDIPVFCYHPKMEPVGMCRMCLVEIGRPVIDRATGKIVLEEDGSSKLQFGPKLETACTTPVSEGMVVLGLTEKAKAGREDILEFLLTSHPLDCPICDKGGECPLQNLTIGFGPGESRYLYSEKMHLAKHVPLGELIYLDRERCIQCARCVRFQDEIVDDPVIGFFNRGRALEIVTYSEPGFDSYFSGNTTDICPVGALTTADFRFGARPWELNAAASICPQCPVGCNITLNVRREAAAGGKWVVKRVMPRQNEWVNEIWICDKGRFAHHFAQDKQRLSRPLVRRQGELVEVDWEEALDIVAERLREAAKNQDIPITETDSENALDKSGQASNKLITLVGGRLSNEDLFNLRQLTDALGGQKVLYSGMAGGDLTSQIGLPPGSNFSDMGAGTTIMVVACDLEEEAPIWWLRVKQAVERGAKLILMNPRGTKLDRIATYNFRYPYGSEAVAVLALINSLSAKRPDLQSRQNRDQQSNVELLMLNSAPGEEERFTRAGPGLKEAGNAFLEAENGVVIYGSEGTGLLSSQALAQACANLLISTDHVGRPNNGLLAVWQKANEQGAWDIGFRPVSDLSQVLKSAGVLYVVGADPAGDDPDYLAEAGGFLVVQELFMTPTAKLADVVLPVQSWVEREGSYTSGERRVQRFYPAIIAGKSSNLPRTSGTRLSGVLPDFGITGQIGQRLGIDLEARLASLVFSRIADEIQDYAELSYTRLAEVVEQWPIIGREDLYYGGTTYKNEQGLGVQLTPGVQRGEAPTLAWPGIPDISIPTVGLLAVPITRLYDQGTTIMPSKLLHQRIPETYVSLNPIDAERLHIPADAQVRVILGDLNIPVRSGTSVLAKVRVDEQVPERVLLVPRSLGLPLDGPRAAEVKLAR